MIKYLAGKISAYESSGCQQARLKKKPDYTKPYGFLATRPFKSETAAFRCSLLKDYFSFSKPWTMSNHLIISLIKTILGTKCQ
jgi:hypothetical protein